jgi:hypothetical protein
VYRALGQVRVGLRGGRKRQQSGDVLAPQVQALVQRPAPTAGRQMKLGATGFARPGEPEGQAGDELLAVLTALPGEPQKFVPASGENPLQRALIRLRVRSRCSAICCRRNPRV